MVMTNLQIRVTETTHQSTKHRRMLEVTKLEIETSFLSLSMKNPILLVPNSTSSLRKEAYHKTRGNGME